MTGDKEFYLTQPLPKPITITYKGIRIFGFGSLISMDLIPQHNRYPNNNNLNQNYVTTSISHSNTVTLHGTPQNEFAMVKTPVLSSDKDTVPRSSVRGIEDCETVLLSLHQSPQCTTPPSFDGSTRFPSLQNFNQIPNRAKEDSNAINFTDADLINSIVMKAELGRIALMGLDDEFMKQDKGTE